MNRGTFVEQVSDLRSDDQALTPSPKCLAEHLLASAIRIRVSGVEYRETDVDRSVN